MQVKVLDAERRRRWGYEDKVRIVEETMEPGAIVCNVARAGTACRKALCSRGAGKHARGAWAAPMSRLFCYPSRLSPPERRRLQQSRSLRDLRGEGKRA